MPEWTVFIVATAGLVYYSRASLRVPESHGFSRFIAWELMLILFTLNMDGWFSSPLNLSQIVSGILMIVSLFFISIGYLSLRLFGMQDKKRSDPSLMVFEKTTRLVSHGIYRYIRHPMYSSLVFLDWGLFFKQMSWLSGSIALSACLFLLLATLAEERENIRYFGTQYQEYMKRSKRFVPFLL